MRKVPHIDKVSATFGDISHMPKMAEIPEEVNMYSGRAPELKVVQTWFFSGLGEDVERLKPRKGIDKNDALRAIAAIMRSWEPKHEHKTAACAYLMREWFELQPENEEVNDLQA